MPLSNFPPMILRRARDRRNGFVVRVTEGSRVNRFCFGLSLVLLAGSLASAQQETSHYPAGAEGLKAATLPPPGTYLKWYNIVYTADTLRDRNGHAASVGFDLDMFATVPRFIKMTEYKFLGADYGMDMLVPFLNVDLQVAAKGVHQSKFGLGDILVEPVLLGWHFEQWDIGAAAAVWCPTGFRRSAPERATIEQPQGPPPLPYQPIDVTITMVPNRPQLGRVLI